MELVAPARMGTVLRAEGLAERAHFGHRDQSDRSIVITPIGDRDRSEATLASRRLVVELVLLPS